MGQNPHTGGDGVRFFLTPPGRESQRPTPMRGFADAPFFGIQAEEGREFAGAEARADACWHVVAGYLAHESRGEFGEEKRQSGAKGLAEGEAAE